MTGCSTTSGQRTWGFGSRQAGTTPKTIAVVGDRPLPATAGEPGTGSKVASDVVEPEPRLDPKARISGRVVDDRGRAVPDAVVRLADGSTKGGRDVRAVTDGSGAFTLGGLRPGSTYWLIAEVDGQEKAQAGRVQAMTAETGVVITLGGDGKDRRTSQPGRVRPISNLQESDGNSQASEGPRVNAEDVGPPPTADDRELDPGPPPKSRPRLSAPEPPGANVGWRNSRGAVPTDRDPGTEPAVAARPGKDGAGVPPESTSDDEGPNPLPPALDPGPSRPDPAPRIAPAEPQARSEPAAPAPDRVALASATAASPPAMPDFGSLPSPTSPPTPGPADVAPASPAGEVASAPVIADLPPMVDPLAQTVPASSAGPAPVPTPSPPSLATNPANPIPPQLPATSPGFAPPGPASPPVPAAEYNPFLLASATSPAPETGPTATTPASAPPPAPEPDEKPTLSPAPKKKWAEIASDDARTSASKAPSTTADAPRGPIATSLVKRIKNAVTHEGREATSAEAAAGTRAVDSAHGVPPATNPGTVAACGYDPRLRKLTDFRLPDLDGNPIRFQDLDADFVLLDFWGTWCPPCIEALPHLIDLQKKYGPSRFKVVGIACETTPIERRRALVDQAARKNGINYPILLSGMDRKPCPVQEKLQIQAFPTLILLDRKGQVIWRGAGTTPTTLDRLDRVLASSIGRGDVARR